MSPPPQEPAFGLSADVELVGVEILRVADRVAVGVTVLAALGDGVDDDLLDVGEGVSPCGDLAEVLRGDLAEVLRVGLARVLPVWRSRVASTAPSAIASTAWAALRGWAAYCGSTPSSR